MQVAPVPSSSLIAARVERTPSFPTLGMGRAARILCAGKMARRGPLPASHGQTPTVEAAGTGRGAPPPARQGPPLAAVSMVAGPQEGTSGAGRGAPPPTRQVPRLAASGPQAPVTAPRNMREPEEPAQPLAASAPALGRGRGSHHGWDGHGQGGYGRDGPRNRYGQWGDYGYDAYGEGQLHGSSFGGCPCFNWYSGGGPGRGFQGPPGNFVEGVTGPNEHFRGGYR